MKASLLEIKNLSVVFKTESGLLPVVRDISFSICRDEVMGMVGESGSGKTVCGLTIMGLLSQPPAKITQGQLLFHEDWKAPQDLFSLPPKSRRFFGGRQIGMVFQEPMTALNPVFTCGDQVAEVIRWHKKVSRKQAREQTFHLFEKVRLPEPGQVWRKYPHQLSGGQKQRVMIAMAISCDPILLIADEPTTALDNRVQLSILELIRDLQKQQKMGVLLISHDLSLVAEIADRVVVVHQGKVVEEGEVSAIFTHPRHPYTQGLLACKPNTAQRRKRLPVLADFMDDAHFNLPGFVLPTKVLPGEEASLFWSTEELAARRKGLHQHNPLLQVSNLHTWFQPQNRIGRAKKPWTKAVDEVSFEVFPGETLGLVGESGCGKTTLGRSILRLVEAREGQIMFGGVDIRRLDSSQMRAMRKRMQLIFQDPFSSLNPRQSIGQAIMEPMGVHQLHGRESSRKAKALDLLKKVQLPADYFSRYPHELSGGQRQRAGIARALAVEPELIICDECVAALDVSVQAQILNLLVQLREEFSLTYIFISHDLSVVRFMSDRLLVMNQGKIVEMGATEDIYGHPQHEYTRSLLTAQPGKGAFFK
ncbi:MAG: ABC transporter ATP-binding protein [Chitinophagaceae bacterium]